MPGLRVRVRGVVQGVGFRPFVWRLAHAHGLSGTVLNDAEGVLVHVWGEPEDLKGFIGDLQSAPPPLARVERVEPEPLEKTPPVEGFTIIESDGGETKTGISPDAATCPDCLVDTFDPANRRYRYPFTNCTHCGPRLSILRSVPYDRAQTSMAAFTMCEDCQREYDDPADRRFHAQPNACPVCGPKVWLTAAPGKEDLLETDEEAIEQAARLIGDGYILAIKGIGGFHLACDAANATAVEHLRQRKRRYRKPFALMARDVESIRHYARVGETEANLLHDHAAPIVILEAAGQKLAPAVAPGQAGLGFMLPYSPLHALLMAALDGPVVMTSGNLSDEPQCFDNAVATEKLSALADFFLLNDRDIVNRLDDSVLKLMAGTPRFLRRARGYTPEALILPDGFAGTPDILAMGAELKNTFCLMKNGQAVVSQHMGDLEERPVLHDYLSNQDLYRSLFDHAATVIAVDLHPQYLSTQEGRKRAEAEGLTVVEVQHHHAHVAACMAELGLALDCEDVLGIVMDGLGMGTDGTIWGGEFLKAGYATFERLAHFKPVAMIGGAKSILEPWRSAYAHLRDAVDWDEDLDIFKGLNARPLQTLDAMIEKGLNAPLASSCGRLFDAAAAVLDICRNGVAYEGEAAILMENLAAVHFAGERSNAYPATVEEGDGPKLSWTPLWRALLKDEKAGVDRGVIAARFHQGVASAVSDLAMSLATSHRLQTVALSGGVFQNRLMLEGVTERLSAAGLRVLSPTLFPANDGGVSLGQAVVAAAKCRGSQ